jgi:hypothetical protein
MNIIHDDLMPTTWLNTSEPRMVLQNTRTGNGSLKISGASNGTLTSNPYES